MYDNEWIYTEKYGFLNPSYYDYSKLKHSKNIIDLIEIGDYVNGYKVLNVYDNYIEINNPELLYDCIVYEKVRENNIKSILTKEQFISVEYVFKED